MRFSVYISWKHNSLAQSPPSLQTRYLILSRLSMCVFSEEQACRSQLDNSSLPTVVHLLRQGGLRLKQCSFISSVSTGHSLLTPLPYRCLWWSCASCFLLYHSIFTQSIRAFLPFHVPTWKPRFLFPKMRSARQQIIFQFIKSHRFCSSKATTYQAKFT